MDYVIQEWLEELEQEVGIGYEFLDRSATIKLSAHTNSFISKNSYSVSADQE